MIGLALARASGPRALRISGSFDRIQGALANLGHQISDTTVGNILKARWDVLGAIDFTAIEVWTKGGLVTYYFLLVERNQQGLVV